MLAMFATLVPMVALATSASAAAPPVQDITAFCANGPAGNPFPDVPAGDAFHDEIACAKDAGVVNGKTDGNFHENEGASRAQESSIAARQADTMVSLAAAGQTLTPLPAPGSNPFSDVGDPPSNGGPSTAPHTDNILRLNTAGIVSGKTATTFDPAGGITRFQFVKIEVNKLEFVTGATLDDTCGASYADGAENDATFGEFVKKATCAGIIQGKAGNVFDGTAFQSRGQTAAETMRGMAWAHGMGFITVLHPQPTALFNVTPTDSATNPLGTGRSYTVSGLAAGNYNIVLFNCGYVTKNADGTFSFPFGTNPNTATNNNAQAGPTGTAFISTINGTPNTGPVNQFAVTPSNGTITFTVNTPSAPTNGAGACVTPVVFDGNNGTLELGANNQPSTDHYGVGGTTFFVPAAASSGNLPGGGIFVQAVNRTAKQFIGCNNFTPDPNTGTATAGPGTFANCFLYNYKAGDSLTVFDPYFGTTKPASLTGNDGACPPGSTCFDSFLSAYDTVTGQYSADPNAASTLTLRDSAPAPVGGLAVVANAAGSSPNTKTLVFNDSGTPSAANYLVFRALATDNGAAANPRFTCPARNIAKFPNTAAPATTTPVQAAENDYALIGAVSDTDPSGATNRQYTFVDTTAPSSAAVCYAVVVLDGPSAHITFLGGGLGQPTTTGSAIPGAVPGAPKITGALAQDAGTVGIADVGDVWQLIFNEPMDPTTLANFIVTVQDGDATPTVVTVTCNGIQASCVLQQADTYNGTAAVKNQVLRITLLTNPTITQAGTVPNLQYPGTITAVSSGFKDLDEALAIDLAGSTDKTLEGGTLSPAPGAEKVGITTGAANATTQTVVLTYNRAVTCTGAVPGQFVANPGVPGGGQSAATLACTPGPGGSVNVTLTFPAGTLTGGVAATIVYNQAASQVDRIHLASNPLVDAVSPDQITTPAAVVNQPAPTLTQLNPATGTTAGGTSITVTGTNFQNGAVVNFCGTPVAATFNSSTSLTTTSPAHAAGNCATMVTNPDFQNSNTLNYTYLAQPAAVIQSAIADPANDRIVVTYDRTVVCSNTVAGRAAWVFNNTYNGPDQGSPASSSPSAVGGSGNQCLLTFVGLNQNDRGTLVYTQPGAAADQVKNTDGVPSTSQNSNVLDQSAPVFAGPGINGFIGTPNSQIFYDQGVLCTSVDPGDYIVLFNGTQQTVLTAVCNAPVNGFSTQVNITTANNVPAAPGRIDVTARNGNDGNTVSDGATPPNFQPVGDTKGNNY